MNGNRPMKIRLPFSSASLAGFALFASLVACDSGTSRLDSNSPNLFTVKRGDLKITVIADGELRAAKQTTVRSQVEGSVQVIYLIPEGSTVEQGQLLVELDASNLIDRKATQEINLERAQAALVQAEQDLQIQAKEIFASEETALSKVTIAAMEVEKFLGKHNSEGAQPGRSDGKNADMVQKLRDLVDGSPLWSLVDKVTDELLSTFDLNRNMGQMAQDILEQIDAVRLAEADLKIKEDRFLQSQKLRSKGFITQNDLESDRFQFDSSDSKVTLEKGRLDQLITYNLKIAHIELSQEHQNTKLEYERVKASNIARRAREQADLKSRKAEFDLAQERFNNLVTQIANAIIEAPTPGLIVYATQGDGRRGREVVEEGGQVRERQEIIVLPDLRKMICDIKVQEADVNKVLRGQRVVLKVNAFPDKAFTGKVLRVSPLPDSGDRWTNNDKKVYKTSIALDGINKILRPGISAAAEIIISEVTDAIHVPIQAVRRSGAVRYVWLSTPRGPEAVRVKVGENNLTHVQILEPLQEGQLVYLAKPRGMEAPQYEQPVLESGTELESPTVKPGVEGQSGASQPDAGEATPINGDYRPKGPRKDGSRGRQNSANGGGLAEKGNHHE